jgi:hypothetical protein
VSRVRENRMHGSTGGGWKRDPTGVTAPAAYPTATHPRGLLRAGKDCAAAADVFHTGYLRSRHAQELAQDPVHALQPLRDDHRLGLSPDHGTESHRHLGQRV